MPDNSAILALPYIQPSQAQKHVTHNEALATLDVLVQLSVAGFGSTTAPADPAEGETHALGATPTGAWAGQGNRLASWRDGAWNFIAPLAGWRAWGDSEGELRIWDGAAWVLPVAGTENLDGVGINTTSDPTNRLSVKADATLLSHDGADHQLKINKNTAADTGSVLFQSGWTGHAEMGLSGNTDFAIKVSDDGTSWREALRFDGANGRASGAAVQSGASDTTSGRLMTVGAFGLGNSAGPAITDADAAAEGGLYSIANLSTSSNTPSALTAGSASLVVLCGTSASFATQIISGQALNQGLFIRDKRGGTWQSWQEIYTNDSILGTVSEVSGAPTGAVIERGSNANGDYVRFADGTQICTYSADIDALAITTASGSVFYSGNTSYTFPASFSGDPHYTSAQLLGSHNSNLRNRVISVQTEKGSPTVFSNWGQIRFFASQSITAAGGEITRVKLFAVGRWF